MSERVTYQWERLRDILATPGVREMLIAYNEELNPIPEVAQIEPDWKELLWREETGIYRVWTARSGGSLAGFLSFHVFPHLSFKRTMFAYDAGHFVAPAFRGSARIGWHLWRNVEPALRDLRVQVVQAHDNARHPLLPFFLALDYKPQGCFFLKVLA